MSIIEEADQKIAAACDMGRTPLALTVGSKTWARMKHEVGSMMTVNVIPTGDTFMGLPIEFTEERDHLSVRVADKPEGGA